MNLKTADVEQAGTGTLFMAGTNPVVFTGRAHQDHCQWVARSLKQVVHERLRCDERGLMARFLCKVTGYCRAQVTRLIVQ